MRKRAFVGEFLAILVGALLGLLIAQFIAPLTLPVLARMLTGGGPR